MAFFKSRASTSSPAESNNDDAQSMDSLRKQARHRLIGATVLVVIAVLGFPLVFDTKPRDLAADIRIEMPDRDAVRPSQPPTVAIPDELVNAKVPLSEAVSGNEQVVTEDRKKTKLRQWTHRLHLSKPVADVRSPDPKPKSPNQRKRPAAPTDAANAAKPTAKETVAERFIVQFGAFRMKPRSRMSAASLKNPVSKLTYTWRKPLRANAHGCVLVRLPHAKKPKKSSIKPSRCN
jgi:DedD protein